MTDATNILKVRNCSVCHPCSYFCLFSLIYCHSHYLWVVSIPICLFVCLMEKKQHLTFPQYKNNQNTNIAVQTGNGFAHFSSKRNNFIWSFLFVLLFFKDKVFQTFFYSDLWHKDQLKYMCQIHCTKNKHKTHIFQEFYHLPSYPSHGLLLSNIKGLWSSLTQFS